MNQTGECIHGDCGAMNQRTAKYCGRCGRLLFVPQAMDKQGLRQFLSNLNSGPLAGLAGGQAYLDRLGLRFGLEQALQNAGRPQDRSQGPVH